MKFTVLLLASTLALAHPALAEEHESGGAHAILLAGEVGAVSPALDSAQKLRTARIYDGTWSRDRNFGARPRINVNATRVHCQWSNVDITSARCSFTFGSRQRITTGMKAHHMIAALHVVGVEGEGAAGSVHFQIENLACRLTPNEISQRAGGGATCNFDTQ